MALCGERSLGERPLKDGETSGQILIETEDYKVERRIHKNRYGQIKTQLFLYKKNGDIVNKPQSILNALFGESVIDPSVFIKQQPKDRIETLKKAFGIDFSELDAERLRMFNERTERKRNEKLLSGQLMAYKDHSKGLPATRSTEDVLKDISQVEEVFNRERESQELRKKEREGLAVCDDKIKKLIKEKSQTATALAETIA